MICGARAIVLACVITLATGCAGGGVKGSPRRICYDAGLIPGTQEFSKCWRDVAHSQGTVVFDDPAAIELYKGIIGAAVAAGTGANNSNSGTTYGGGISSAGSTPPSLSTRQYFATRKGDNMYDLMGGPLVATRFCYVFANSSPSIIAGSKLVFLTHNQSCDIAQIYNR